MDIPTYVIQEFKTKYDKVLWLNLNYYTGQNRLVRSNCKKWYTSSVKSIISSMSTIKGQVYIHYVYYHNNKRLFDISNVCSVIDKYICDAITEYGKWNDDNISIIPHVHYSFGGIEKEKRCEMRICETKDEYISSIISEL